MRGRSCRYASGAACSRRRAGARSTARCRSRCWIKVARAEAARRRSASSSARRSAIFFTFGFGNGMPFDLRDKLPAAVVPAAKARMRELARAGREAARRGGEAARHARRRDRAHGRARRWRRGSAIPRSHAKRSRSLAHYRDLPASVQRALDPRDAGDRCEPAARGDPRARRRAGRGRPRTPCARRCSRRCSARSTILRACARCSTPPWIQSVFDARDVIRTMLTSWRLHRRCHARHRSRCVDPRAPRRHQQHAIPIDRHRGSFRRRCSSCRRSRTRATRHGATRSRRMSRRRSATQPARAASARRARRSRRWISASPSARSSSSRRCGRTARARAVIALDPECARQRSDGDRGGLRVPAGCGGRRPPDAAARR